MNHLSHRKKTRPPTRRGKETRQRLLDAAERVFGDRGFEQASIAEITRRAGVALGTFYIYFPDKHAIFAELVEELGGQMRRALAESIVDVADRVEMERAGLRAFLRFAATHRNVYRVVRQAEFVDPAMYRRFHQKLADGYAARLRAAMGSGQVRRFDPELLAFCLMGVGDFVGMRFVLWQKDADLDAIVEQVVDFIARGIGRADPPKKTRRSHGTTTKSRGPGRTGKPARRV